MACPAASNRSECPISITGSLWISACTSPCCGVPTRPIAHAAVYSRHAGAGSGDRLIDIGSGDGRFCVAAAQQVGVAAALGLELDPILVAKSQAAAAACGLGPPQVHFLEVRRDPNMLCKRISVYTTQELSILLTCLMG